MNIVKFLIEHKMTVYVFVSMILILGFISFLSLPRESFPNIDVPYIIVTTYNNGVSPKDIEASITIEIEKKLPEVQGIKHITSKSYEGMSQIFIEFYPDVKMNEALQKVKDQVDKAKPDLPKDADAPVVKDYSMSDFPVLMVNLIAPEGLTYDNPEVIETMRVISKDVKDEIEKVTGVLGVDVVGDREREIQVEFDPIKLNSLNVQPLVVMQKLINENLDISAGNIKTPNLQYSLKVSGEFESQKEIENLMIFTIENNPIYIKDIAEVKFGYKEVDTISRLNGKGSVSISVKKRPNENVIRVVQESMKIVDKYNKTIPKGYKLEIVSDQSEFVEELVTDLQNEIMNGLILVISVLFLFLGLRNALLTSFAIPSSIFITFLILIVFSITLNMVVLMSLILVLGRLVDDAIVLVENVYRLKESGYDNYHASIEGSKKIAIPVLASTVTTIAVYIPLLFWPGLIGSFMGFLPKTILIALPASYFVAIFIIPTFTDRFMKIKKGSKEVHNRNNHETKELGKFLTKYKNLLQFALRNKVKTLVLSFAITIAMIVLFMFVGEGIIFFPKTEPKEFNINVKLAQGKSVDATLLEVKKVEAILKEYEDIKYYVSNIGENGSNLAVISVQFYKMEERKSRITTTIVDEIRQRIQKFSTYEITLKKEEMAPDVGLPINIELSGDDYENLGELSKTVLEKIKNIKGIVDLKTDYEVGRPELKIIVDRNKSSLLGISTNEIGSIYRACYAGILAGVYRTSNDDIDIRIIAQEKYRKDFSVLDQIKVIDSQLNEYPVSSLIKRELVGGPSYIKRIDQKWVVTISSDLKAGYLANNVLQEIDAKLKDYKMPEGYKIKYTGEEESKDESSSFLILAFIIDLMLLILVLVTEFNSLAIPLIIMTSIVLSLGGVFFGLIVTFTTFSIIMTGLGIISLAGIVVTNAIVLIDYFKQIWKPGMPVEEALIEAGLTRLRPVLLTAVTTILGMIPMALGFSFDFFTLTLKTGGEANQMWGPMAVAIIFGLSFATILTLVVVPCLLALKESFTQKMFEHKSVPKELVNKLVVKIKSLFKSK